MDLEELRSVQTRERATDGLQDLRDSFYEDVATYLGNLRDTRDEVAAESEDPFRDPEVNDLTDEIETAEQVAEAIYERRIGKLLKEASLAASGMSEDPAGLTNEERDLYRTIVDEIEENKSRVLERLLDREQTNAPVDSPGGSSNDAETRSETGAKPVETHRSGADGDSDVGSTGTPGPSVGEEDRPRSGTAAGFEDDSAIDSEAESTFESEPSSESEHDRSEESAGTGPRESDSEPTRQSNEGGSPNAPQSTEPGHPHSRSTHRDGDTRDTGTDPEDDGTDLEGDQTDPEGDQTDPASARDRDPPDSTAANSSAQTSPAKEGSGRSDNSADGDDNRADRDSIDRMKVRITEDVGEILGVDQRSYSLATDDVVDLPEENAMPLLENDAAERVKEPGIGVDERKT
ncbi:MAG: hypothetical protein ABEJ58_09005 [Halodesulfurarchaeum sp.]